jgi:hypothetical protein
MQYLAMLFFLLPIPAFAISGLPLTDGYYVSEGTQCPQANQANTAFVHAKGINLPDALCEFQAVNSLAKNEFSFAGTCAHPEQRTDYLNEGTITILEATKFRFYDGVIKGTFEYCPPDNLPANLR